jgi:polypeptide N-acetylgalactosaminyltransferase
MNSKKLLKASIIMCFHNEAWSVLLRGLHSIINHTPSNILEEIILVDDFSHFEYLFEPLNVYLNDHFSKNIVKVIRNEKREGLIRSRLFGAREAKGQVLVFLDSHIEATVSL